MRIYVLIIIGIFMICSSNNSYSQCCTNPLNEVTISRYVTYGSDSCKIDITFCHEISPLGIRYIKLCSISIPYLCHNWQVDLSDPAFWDSIYVETLKYSNTLYAFPPCDTINQFAANVIITKANCWTIIDDPIAQMSFIKPCEGEAAFCYTDYAVCWENGQLKRIKLGVRIVGENTCYYEGIVMFPNVLPGTCFDTCY